MEHLIIYSVLAIAGIFLSLLFARWILRVDYSVKLKEMEVYLLIGIAEKIEIDPRITNKIKWELNMIKDKSDALPKPLEPSTEQLKTALYYDKSHR
jgi:hypothetical protein